MRHRKDNTKMSKNKLTDKRTGYSIKLTDFRSKPSNKKHRKERDVIIDLDAKNAELPSITPGTMTIREISEGFEDSSEFENGGVTSMCGKLIIRPTYQREYLHKPGDRWTQNLIRSIILKKPINTIYIGKCGCSFKDLIDGQQRTITICYFIHGKFAIYVNVDGKKRKLLFNQLDKSIQRDILNYELNIAWCEGTEEQKKRWFNTINEESLILNAQEIRNAIYSSEFTEKLKKNFTNRKCFANKKDSKYYAPNYHGKMDINRQEYLEFALDLYSYKHCIENGFNDVIEYYDDRIDCYMDYAHDKFDEADKVINYYKEFCDWFYDVFMRGKGLSGFQSLSRVDWARVYYNYKEETDGWSDEKKEHASDVLRNVILANYRAFIYCGGAYEWILRGEHESEFNHFFSLRGFSKSDREDLYVEQGGIDPLDGKHYELKDMHMHHINTWRNGGISSKSNGVLLSIENHRKFHDGGFPKVSMYKLMSLRNSVIDKMYEHKMK